MPPKKITPQRSKPMPSAVQFVSMPRDRQDNLLDGLFNVWEGLENKSLNSPIPKTALQYAEARKYAAILQAVMKSRNINQHISSLQQMKFPKKGPFLIYSIVHSKIYRWILKNGRIVHWDFKTINSKFASLADLDKAVNSIANFDPSKPIHTINNQMKTDLKKLFVLLLSGMRPHTWTNRRRRRRMFIRRYKFLTIVPEGILLSVPYPALITARDRYFVEIGFPCNILESLLMRRLLSLQVRPQGIPRTYLVSGGVFSGEYGQLERMPSAKQFVSWPRPKQDNLLDRLFNVWERFENKSLNSSIPKTALRYAEARKYAAILQAVMKSRDINQHIPSLQQMKFPRKGQFLIYSIVNSKIYRWVLQKGKIVHLDFKDIASEFDSRQNDLDKCVNAICSAVEYFQRTRLETEKTRITRTTKTVLKKLYPLLFEGMERYLKNGVTGSRRINRRNAYTTIVPDGILLRVPYSALIDSHNRYFINKGVPYIILESLLMHRILSEQARKRPSPQGRPKTNLVLGGDFEGRYDTDGLTTETLSPLTPETLSAGLVSSREEENMEKELNSITRIFSEPTTRNTQQVPTVVLKKTQSTTWTFALCCNRMRPKIIHIASHCGPRIPSQSESTWGMVLLNQFLTPEMVRGHNLDGVELVFLNACCSARNPISAAEGCGFNRAFFAAGVPTVISCLTSVFSRISILVASEFYRNWQNGSNIAKALQDAIVKVKGMPIIPDIPFLWFGWQVYGVLE